MTMLARLELWKEQGILSPDQDGTFRKPRSRPAPLSHALNSTSCFTQGVLALVAGLGWTISTWSQQLGDVLILTALSILLAVSLWYCFSRAAAWSPAQTAAPTVFFDYVLYLGGLVWCLELVYLENRFHVLTGQWDLYLLATALFFFLLAYRFDNRFVLSLALSSASWMVWAYEFPAGHPFRTGHTASTRSYTASWWV